MAHRGKGEQLHQESHAERTIHRRAFLLSVLDTFTADVFVGHLKLIDATQLAATCKRLRGVHGWLFVFDGSIIDFPRVVSCRRRVFVESVLLHINNLLSVQGLSTSRVTSIKIMKSSITDDAIRAIAANFPSLASLDVYGCWNLSDDSIKVIAAK